MPPFRRRTVRKPKQKLNPYTMTAEQFEKFTKVNPVEAERFCNSQSIDAGRQGDHEMSVYWSERAKKIRDKQNK